MIEALLGVLKGLPPEFATMIIAMLPVTELRVSIPIALGPFDMSPLSAMVWSVIGNMVPAVIILIFIDKGVRWLSSRSGFLRRRYEWWVARTSKGFKKGAIKFGAAIGLAIFVGIPLPFTGAWSGALAAFLFQIPKRIALLSIFIGVMIAALIVTGISLGAFRIFL